MGFVVARSWNIRPRIRDSQNVNKIAREPHVVLRFSFLPLNDNNLTGGTFIVCRSSTIVLIFCVMPIEDREVILPTIDHLKKCNRQDLDWISLKQCLVKSIHHTQWMLVKNFLCLKNEWIIWIRSQQNHVKRHSTHHLMIRKFGWSYGMNSDKRYIETIDRWELFCRWQ